MNLPYGPLYCSERVLSVVNKKDGSIWYPIPGLARPRSNGLIWSFVPNWPQSCPLGIPCSSSWSCKAISFFLWISHEIIIFILDDIFVASLSLETPYQTKSPGLHPGRYRKPAALRPFPFPVRKLMYRKLIRGHRFRFRRLRTGNGVSPSRWKSWQVHRPGWVADT